LSLLFSRLALRKAAQANHDVGEFALRGRRHQELISVYLEALKTHKPDASANAFAGASGLCGLADGPLLGD